MLRSPNSPLDPHDAHLRDLLDQRATRADLHSRIPSLSEFSDTPSLYSHAYLSPQPPHFNRDMGDMSSNYASPTRSDRNRLNDLAVSMLDMEDDEPSTSFESSIEYDDDDQSTVDQSHEEDDEDFTNPHMSLLGPKMRFHSKAPWELDEAMLQEEDESEDDIDGQSIISASTRGKGGPARHFRFGGSKSGNPGRSSRESSRSRRAKKSFDTTSSQTSYGRGAIHTLAQAGMSSTSLVAGVSRQPFSSGRVRSKSPSARGSPHLSPSSPRSPVFFGEPLDRHRSSNNARGSGSGESDSRPSFTYSIEDTHPYARSNAAVSQEQISRSLTQSFVFPRDDPALAVTDSTEILSQSLSRPSANEPSREPPQSPRLQAFLGQGREISSPVAFRSTALPADSSDLLPPRTGNLSGWTERAASPSFNLISLEEARAQRSRSITSQSTSTTQNPVGAPSVTFPYSEDSQQNGQSPAHSITSRARARSISAGARAKQALTSIVGNTPPKVERRDSEPAVVMMQASPASGQKSLKHKKSGFMRLFNGGRDEPPPPVPSLSEGFAAFNAQQSAAAPKSTKINRIPVPQVSPSMFEQPQLGEETSGLAPRPTPSPKRTPPPLSLVGSSHNSGYLKPHPQFRNDVAQSAPANVTEFPALKLRPISTVFSAHFGDHILPSPRSDDDPDTPSSLQSPNTVISPVTPGPYGRPEPSTNHKATGSESNPAEDQSAVIHALQNQIVTAKRAWQRQIWELEGQVRDLKTEVEDLRATGTEKGYCELCGRGTPSSSSRDSPDGSSSSQGDVVERKPVSVVHRPRARTGTGQSRFGSIL